MPIPIIDLFAGPGGLGEGFTSILDKDGNRIFKIALSIEKDEFAHKTLTLRSFLRQFPYSKYPVDYYQFIKGEISFAKLFELYPKEAARAKNEAWKFELGNPETYSLLDKRIHEALNGEKNFLLIGGPPCQAYSLVGRSRRQEGGGLNKEDERVYLYREYYRILAEHKPQIFVMENVKGLLSSRVDNDLIFDQLLSDLKNPVESYRKLQGKKDIKSRTKYKIYSLVKRHSESTNDGNPIFNNRDFVIKSEEYGIPQTRHRVILLGVRSDFPSEPGILKPENRHIAIKEVLNGMPPLRSGLSKETDSKEKWKETLTYLVETIDQRGISKDVLKKMQNSIRNLHVPHKDRGDSFIPWIPEIDYNRDWFIDEKMEGVCNHETRSHIKEDLLRYLFVSSFAKISKRSPKLSDFPKSLLPKHKNAGKGVSENKFADRFRVQLENQPSKTITSHISKDGHYYIHPDPSQCRSLTVREAARIQTFPDNYFFCGPRTEQFHQVGNAVPPLMAKSIAQLIQHLLK